MKSVLWPLLMTIGGGVLYHLSSKSIPRTTNPLLAIILAYTTGIIVCLGCIAVLPDKPAAQDVFKQVSWAVLGLGLGAAAIEVGFLLAYRAGGPLSTTSLIMNVVVAVLLLIVGLIAFREQISALNALGALLCVVGLILITKG